MAGKKSKAGPHHDLALTVTAVLVIAFVMVLQMSARKLKKWSEDQKHANDILEASERELTVLGLIAFGLFVLETVAADAKGEWYQVFHEVHFALFTVALFYVIVNVALYALARHVGRMWRNIEEADMHDHWGVTAKLHRLREELHIPPLAHHLLFGSYWIRGVCSNPSAWLEYQKCLEHMTFHEVRRDFLRSHHLPHNFSFATYLESCMQHVCLEFSEIRDGVWFLLILVLVAQLYLSTVFSPFEVDDSIVLLGAIVIVLGLVVFLKVKWIYWYLLHSEILHHDSAPTFRAAIEDGKEADDVEAPQRKLKLATMQRELFWFKNPGLVVTLLELCLFILSGSVALFVYKARNLAKNGELAAPLCLIFAAVAILLFLVPRVLPRLTLITYVGEMSDPRRIAAVVRKQQQRGDFDEHDRLPQGEGASAAAAKSSRAARKKPAHGERKSFDQSLRSLSEHSIRAAVEEKGISTISTVFVVIYVFCVAVTLDDAAESTVLDGNVSLIIREIELALGAYFVIEVIARLYKHPKSISCKLDALLVFVCVALNVTSFFVSPSRTMHALSGLIVFRLMNTDWHNERLEHIRLSPDELFVKEEKHSHHGGHKSHGSGLSRSGSSQLSLLQLVEDQQQAAAAAATISNSSDQQPAPLRRVGSSSNMLSALGRQPSFLPTSIGAASANNASSSTPIAGQQHPPWLQFYLAPIENQLDGLGPAAPVDQFGEAGFYEPDDPRAAAARRAHQLIICALDRLNTKEVAGESSDYIAEIAMREALGSVKEHAGEEKDAGGRESKVRGSHSVVSTKAEELEDSLYFNSVLQAAFAVQEDRKRQSIFSLSLFSRSKPDEAVNLEVKLLLTRDQLIWYDVTKTISEINPTTGQIFDTKAKSADKPVAIAVDSPNAAQPAGRVHLSTILRVDASNSKLVVHTTANVVSFAFGDAEAPASWKMAVLDAIDQEDDDDPFHPIQNSFSKGSSQRRGGTSTRNVSFTAPTDAQQQTSDVTLKISG